MPNGSTESLLVDSKILVYAVDVAEQEKSIRANEVLDAIHIAECGLTNSQVLIEFFAASTKLRSDRAPILTTTEASKWVDRWLAAFAFRPITEAMIREAARGAVDYQMSIFDAQIWAAAKLSGAATVLTEDIQSAPVIEGVEFTNPLTPSFALTQIGL